MATAPEEAQAPTRRDVSGQQLALIVGGLVVLLAALWFLFLRGGDEATSPTAVPTTTPSVAPTTPEEDVEEPEKGPVQTFDVFAAKDPFEPLVTEAAVSTDTGEPVTQPGGAPAPGETPASGDPTVPGSNDGDNVQGHRVRLIDVFTRAGEQQAQVQVDGTVYTVAEGETFADNFQLLSISGDCATMLFGDDQFTLCQGEEILK